MNTLSPRARRTRVAATLMGLLLLLAGTLWGTDDDFPFGPFSMYAGVNPPDQDAPDTRVEATTDAGDVIVLGERDTGIRRAEIEGQEQRYREHPELLAEIADAYARRQQGGPGLAEIRIVIRWHDIQDSRPMGTWRDEVVARWRLSP